MKLLLVADLHSQERWMEWVSHNAPNYDLICIAGDLQDAFSDVNMYQQIAPIKKWLLKLDTPTIVCSGNHDYWVAPGGIIDKEAEAGWIRSLRHNKPILGVDGDLITFKGHRIAINGWLKPLRWKPPIEVLVTHAPPEGCPCAWSSTGRDCGDPELWGVIRDSLPRLILCGHIHDPQAFGCYLPRTNPQSLVLVPGFADGAESPSHWEIDFSNDLVTHSTGLRMKIPAAICSASG